MICQVDRRDFLRTAGAVGVGMGLAGLGAGRLLADEPGKGAPHADRLGWRLGVEVWTFRLFPFFEMIDKTASLGLRYLETGAGWPLTKDRPDVTFSDEAPDSVIAEMKKKLADSNVKLISYWPKSLSKDIGDSRKRFEFAKQMGIEILAGEPEENALDTLEKLSEEYQIGVAIHNHPQPAHYWNPDTVLKACRGRSRRIGVCGDTGHWLRSGLDPIQCLKKLEGRIICLHFKDLNQPGPDAHDVPWGTGACEVKGMLTELHRQGIKPPFFVEYEHQWENNLPEIAQSIAYFDKVAAELSEKP